MNIMYMKPETYDIHLGGDLTCYIPHGQDEVVYKSYSDPSWVKTLHRCVDKYQWRIPILLKDEKIFDDKVCLKYQYMPDVPESSKYVNEFLDYCKSTYEELEKKGSPEKLALFMRLHREAFTDFKFEKSQLKYHNLGLNLKTDLVHVRDINPFNSHTVFILKAMTGGL